MVTETREMAGVWGGVLTIPHALFALFTHSLSLSIAVTAPQVTSSSDSHSSILKSYGSHFDMSSNELSQVGLQPRYAKGHHRRR